ncbi:MAG: hypothetical protein KBD16_03130 [Candidatus Pacebacteria bacterium]|nr:hypothetical protein [Candidatus Paceibacterota bacterium]
MGVSLVTLLEIFTNPRDLEVVLEQDQKTKEFAVGFFRGPGHNFKPLISTEPGFPTREAAIGTVKRILEAAIQHGGVTLHDPTILLRDEFNPDPHEPERRHFLSSAAVEAIVEKLKLQDEVVTYR